MRAAEMSWSHFGLIRRLRSAYWHWVEFWGDLRYARTAFQRRTAVRGLMCNLGLHWPITFWDERYSAGGYDPPEPHWACDYCGKDRLPYRAWWWNFKPRLWWHGLTDRFRADA